MDLTRSVEVGRPGHPLPPPGCAASPVLVAGCTWMRMGEGASWPTRSAPQHSAIQKLYPPKPSLFPKD